MTSLDLAYSYTHRPAVRGGHASLWAAIALLALVGLPALTAPDPGAAPIDWHGNAAGHRVTH
ncbi:hypothetical protein PVT71_12940 [Salipiger sp. H15]|uniref:Uncharacterized protein n=1 Tax=Alloyangia sp. H15 TaxID=3029062 RepID=A0AAU8AEK2_9RHOB